MARGRKNSFRKFVLLVCLLLIVGIAVGGVWVYFHPKEARNWWEDVRETATEKSEDVTEDVKSLPDRLPVDEWKSLLSDLNEEIEEWSKSLPESVGASSPVEESSSSSPRHEVAEGDWEAEHLRWGKPDVDCDDCTLLVREGYVAYNDNERQIPLWVAYRLDPEDVEGPGNRNRSRFAPDPLLSNDSKRRGDLSDYKGSGYDRGHMAPAADQKKTQALMDECFFLSNMCPQLPGLNRGEWRLLEEGIRDWLDSREQLWIVMGPSFEGKAPVKTLGDGVAIPTHFWKVVVDEESEGEWTAIAFWFPHIENLAPFMTYSTTIDRIEERTGVDLFSDLPDDIEAKLESSFEPAKWK